MPVGYTAGVSSESDSEPFPEGKGDPKTEPRCGTEGEMESLRTRAGTATESLASCTARDTLGSCGTSRANIVKTKSKPGRRDGGRSFVILP